MILTTNDVETVKNALNGLVPVVGAGLDTLGGAERGCIMLCICFDPRETWANNIMENSRYMRVMIDHNLKIEQFSGCVAGHKWMRSAKCKDLAHAISKIQAYIAKVQAPILTA